MHNIAADRHLIASYPHEPQSGLSTLLSSASTPKNKVKKYEPTNQHASFGKTSPTHKHLLHVAKVSLSEQPKVFG
jgi:GTPase involved in cell partitioning and DNA repair